MRQLVELHIIFLVRITELKFLCFALNLLLPLTSISIPLFLLYKKDYIFLFYVAD